jgi:hypothetical protein
LRNRRSLEALLKARTRKTASGTRGKGTVLVAKLNRWKALAMGAAVGLGSISSAHASPLSMTGSFDSDDAVALLAFQLSALSSVTIRTLSYNGGTFADGRDVPAGGFDPVLTLFNAAGTAIAVNDDQIAFDAQILRDLDTGSYTVSLTQYDNFLKTNNLSGGFQRAGQGDFTAAFGCSAGRFCDNLGQNRTGAWALEISGSGVEAPGGGEVAVSAPAAAFLPALLGLALVYRRRQRAA